MAKRIGIFVCLALVISIISFHFAKRRSQSTQPPAIPPGQEIAKPQPSPSELQVRDAENARMPIEMRVADVNKMGRSLSNDHVIRLRALMNKQGDAVLRNDIFTKLAEQETVPKGLVTDLLAAWNNPKEDQKWRLFTLQHLAIAYNHASNEERYAARDALVSAADSPDKVSAGHAILSLQCMSEKHPELKHDSLQTSKRILASKAPNPDNLASALYIATKAGNTEILPQARKLASDENRQVRLRMSAICTLGQLGKAEDRPLLQTLSQHSNKRIRYAASYQLKELERRTKSN